MALGASARRRHALRPRGRGVRRPGPPAPAGRRLAAGLVLLALLAGCGRTTRVAWGDGVLRFAGGGKRGDEQGLWTYYYRDGQPREHGRYEDGRRVGVWTQWWPNGQRASEGLRVPKEATGGSEREGEWTFWHENGQLRARGRFEAGRREGEWIWYLDLGAIDTLRTGVYEGGVKQPR